MTHRCQCPVCGDTHLAMELTEYCVHNIRGIDCTECYPPPEEEEPIPLVQPTVHCPICWTYGHVHRKDCKYSEAGMIHHVPL